LMFLDALWGMSFNWRSCPIGELFFAIIIAPRKNTNGLINKKILFDRNTKQIH
jgi:hypothetical protein